MQNTNEINVWDRFVRSFHWGLVATFAICYLTEDDFMNLHVWSGYAIMLLLALRFVWGFVGTPHARFSDFVYRPSMVWQYTRDVLFLRAKRYIGHNPAGGAMVVLFFIGLILASLSGIVLYGADEHAGPLASMMSGASDSTEEILEEVHEFFANFTLLLVVIHLGGVIFESLLHRENLIQAMINGRKKA
jgi:cytochrome b